MKPPRNSFIQKLANTKENLYEKIKSSLISNHPPGYQLKNGSVMPTVQLENFLRDTHFHLYSHTNLTMNLQISITTKILWDLCYLQIQQLVWVWRKYVPLMPFLIRVTLLKPASRSP